MSAIISTWLEGIFTLIRKYVELQPEGTTQSFSARLTIGNEPTKFFFKTGYRDENRPDMRGSHPRTPVSVIRIRNVGPNHLYMSTNQAPGDAYLSTPIYAATEWTVEAEKNTIWSLFLQATQKTGEVTTYTDIVVDFIY